MARRAWFLVAAAALLLTLVLLGEAAADEIGDGDARAASRVASPATHPRLSPTPPRRLDLGTSVQGRPIDAVRVGHFFGRRPILVVGCIHGNEPAGIAIARDLIHDGPPPAAFLWVIPVLNPDGLAAHTRQNARGVDLNRNFPYRWAPLSGIFYSGPHALSEPETRIVRRFILNRRPVISIWFHQHQDLVDRSGGRIAIELRYAHLTGMRLVRLPRYPGSATRWENHVMPGTTAFVVELPAGRLSAVRVERFSDAILQLI